MSDEKEDVCASHPITCSACVDSPHREIRKNLINRLMDAWTLVCESVITLNRDPVDTDPDFQFEACQYYSLALRLVLKRYDLQIVKQSETITDVGFNSFQQIHREICNIINKNANDFSRLQRLSNLQIERVNLLLQVLEKDWT